MRSLDDRPYFGQDNPIRWTQFRSEFLSSYKPPVVAKSTESRMQSVFREIESLDLDA